MLKSLTDWSARIFDPFVAPPDPAPPQTPMAFAIWTLRPYRTLLLVYAALSLSIGVVEVGIIQAIGGLVDLAGDGPAALFRDHWGAVALLFVLVGLVRPLVVIAQGMTMSLAINPLVPEATAWRLHRHALGQGVTYFHNDFAGRLAQKEMQGSAALYDIIVDALNALGMLIAFTIAMVAALAMEDWRLAIPAVLWILSYAVLLRITLPRVRAAARNRADVRAGVTGQFVDSFSNIVTVKLFAHSDREEAAAKVSLNEWRASSFRFGTEVTRLRLGLNLLNAALMIGTLGVALWLWWAQSLGPNPAVTIGVASAAGMLAFRATGLSGWIAFTALAIFSNIGTLEDAVKTLTPPHDVTDDPGAAEPKPATGRIAYEGVRFHYGKTAGAIEDLSLEIQPGEKVGLVGPSGAGKSTLVSLLLRLYDVEGGRVTLDGVDIRALSQDGLRRQIGVITQETAMFNRSARENILYGDPGADEAAVIRAARQAHAHEFLLGLEDFRGRTGYDAHLGERGVKLSGGQRQRIALARVLLKNAPIVVLDEATSALDSESEAAILTSIETLMADRTVLAIAHRLSTIAAMDRIVVLDQGRIAEQGPHQALLANGGLYAKLWSLQSGGFIGGVQAPDQQDADDTAAA